MGVPVQVRHLGGEKKLDPLRRELIKEAETVKKEPDDTEALNKFLTLHRKLLHVRSTSKVGSSKHWETLEIENYLRQYLGLDRYNQITNPPLKKGAR